MCNSMCVCFTIIFVLFVHSLCCGRNAYLSVLCSFIQYFEHVYPCPKLYNAHIFDPSLSLLYGFGRTKLNEIILLIVKENAKTAHVYSTYIHVVYDHKIAFYQICPCWTEEMGVRSRANHKEVDNRVDAIDQSVYSRPLELFCL